MIYPLVISTAKEDIIMSTTLLNRGWKVYGYNYCSTKYEPGKITYHIQHKQEELTCSVCGSKDVLRRGTVTRILRTLPIGSQAVYLSLPVQRVECRRCRNLRQTKIGIANPRCSYTKQFERYVLDLLKWGTIKDVAKHLKISWDVVKEIQKKYLAKKFTKPRLKDVTHIAIDEISIGKGHRYLTVVLDLDTGRVLFVGEGKGADALTPFWRRLWGSRAKIEAVAIDMSPSYICAVMDNLPNASIVFDRFHVMKLFNEKLSNLRRDLQREATTALQKKVLKGIRWLLLMNEENVSTEKKGRRLSDQERLQRALTLNQPLACAYYMKEELRLFWMQGTKMQAENFLEDWIARAEVSGIRILKQMAKTLASHRYGLLSWYDHPISTGPLEGTNTKIRVMQRQSYGYRDKEFQKLKIYALKDTKYALVG